MIAILLCIGSCTRLDCNDWNSSGFFKKATAADVRRCLAAGAKVNVRDEFGWTPLHRTAAHGTTDTIAALIEAGADMEARDRSGWTPLHRTAAHGTADTIAALIEAGADMEARDRSGRTPLHIAAEYGTAETVAALIDAGADPGARDRNGRFPADLAEDNPEVKDHDIFRVLEEARNAAQPDCGLWNSSGFFEKATAADVKICLAAGADVNARTQDGWTPLLVAAAHGTADTIAALMESGADMEVRTGEVWTPLHVAARFGTAETVAAFIEAGADTEARDGSGWTPLHMAAAYGAAETVAVLIESGADPGARNRNGRFPADLAEDNPKVKDHNIFRALEKARNAARPDCSLWNSRGFLENTTAADVRRCLAAGAEVNARDRSGRTPLHMAAAYGTAATVAAFIEAGADPGARDRDGRFPADLAEDNPKVRGHDIFRVLEKARNAARPDCGLWNSPAFFENATAADVKRCLTAGTEVNARDENGWTPLLLAAAYGTAETTAALVGAGADPKARDRDGRFPADMAEGNGKVKDHNIFRALEEARNAAQRDCGLWNSPAFFRNAMAADVERCLTAGAGVNARDENGWTPLLLAAAYGTAETAAALVGAGADPKVRDRDGRFPADMAEGNGRVKDHNIFQALEEARNIAQPDCGLWNSSGFFENAMAADVKRCLTAGAYLEARDEFGWTPLHVAARYGRAETVTALVKAGADMGAWDEDGDTPLHVAAGWGTAATVAALIKAGAKVNARSEYIGEHPTSVWFTAGVKAGQEATMRRNRSGATPLHWAAQYGDAETVVALVNAGADIRAKTNGGSLPADLAEDNPKVKDRDIFRVLDAAR